MKYVFKDRNGGVELYKRGEIVVVILSGACGSAVINYYAEKLKKLEYSGHRVVREVFDTEEIYSGPYVVSGPDLIILSEYGFDMKGSVKKKEVFGRSNLQGMHTWDNAFFWANKKKGEDLSISDLSSIIMENFA